MRWAGGRPGGRSRFRRATAKLIDVAQLAPSLRAPVETPTLVVFDGQTVAGRHPIGGTLVVGRDPANQVALDDNYLSRRHCEVRFVEDRVIVVDLGSYNGTYVNGQRIHEECYVLPGDVLKMGRTRMFVDFGDVAAQSGSLKIYTPNLAPEDGVEPVLGAKQPQVATAYARITRDVPPSVAFGDPSASSGASGTRLHRRIRPDDKTPIPFTPGEDSAVARASSGGASAGASERSRDGLRVLARITRVLTNLEDVHEFLEYVLGRLMSVIPAERGLVMRLDRERRGLYPEVGRSARATRSHTDVMRQGVSHTIARKVISERVSVLVNDAVLDKRFKDASSVQELQVRSVLCAPLWLGEGISGLIYLDHLLHAYAFTEGDRDLLVAVANVAALGLERSRPR